MNIEDIKKEAIEDLNADNERITRERVKEIIREISREQKTIENSSTRILELKRELKEIEIVEEVTTKNIL